VDLNERVVVLKNGLPVRALGPGKHRMLGFGISVLRWATDTLVFEAAPAVRAVLPAAWFAEVRLGDHERAVLYRDGKPQVFLRPGVHRYWVLDPSVELRRFSLEEPMPEMTSELRMVVPASEYAEAIVEAHERGLHYVRGRLLGVLEPGQATLWTSPSAPVLLRKVDMRQSELVINGQELISRDKVSLRLTLAAEYAISDAARAATAVTSVRDALYLMVQLAARGYVAGVTLDEVLEGRDAFTRYLEDEVVPKARSIGVRVERVGVKDVVLPGEMKALLNRVIEAEKEAAANVILRREETQAVRQLSNTARMMAEQPVLMRLKEMETMKEIATQIREVRVVVGAEGMTKLLPAALLGETSKVAGA
jgi:regulator of protease activity HflC (stomatin/prohibitin superfamily)